MKDHYWWSCYRMWYSEAMDEARASFPGENIKEVTETGQVHIRNTFALTPHNTVSPWEESEHFVEN